MMELAGLPLSMALARLREAGFDPVQVEITRGRNTCEDGEMRALRFQNGTLLAACFPVLRKGEET